MARCRLGASRWAELIDEWRQSGLSLPEFCRRHGLRRGTMQNWVYKPAFRRSAEDARRGPRRRRDDPAAAGGAETPPGPPRFLPVTLIAEPAPAAAGPELEPDPDPIVLILDGRRRIAVAPGFDAETLRRLVDAVEARA